MNKMLQVVNDQDTVLDIKTREECHEGEGLLHRATTVLLTNDKGEFLITRRSQGKTLWPNFWDTTASTHPYEKELYIDAAFRSLKIELGINPNIKQIDKFIYKERFNKTGSENEMCALFAGMFIGKIIPNKDEISEYQWISIKDLKKLIREKKEVSPWLIHAFKRYLKHFK